MLPGNRPPQGRRAGAVLKVDDIHVHYGHVHVLRGVSLEIGDGAVVALLGANGAGKSTLLKAISGIVKPSRGTIHFDGEEISRLLPDNTWLQQLEIRSTGKSREIQITGETTSSSRLIEILERSKLLQNATPNCTVTSGPQPN